MLIRRKELPPRARRIRWGDRVDFPLFGTTSACAENTKSSSRNGSNVWNYLRVRGEYTRDIDPCGQPWELPPRARRIRFGRCGVNNIHGTTSACAENTGCNPCTPSCHRNYLRVRGEYYAEPWPNLSWGELPPRARRIHLYGEYLWRPEGTTSACAENTGERHSFAPECGNYLRVRGEYWEDSMPM